MDRRMETSPGVAASCLITNGGFGDGSQRFGRSSVGLEAPQRNHGLWARWRKPSAKMLYFCNNWHITSAIAIYPHALDITSSPHPATHPPAASLDPFLRRSLVNGAGPTPGAQARYDGVVGYVLFMFRSREPRFREFCLMRGPRSNVM